MKTFNAKAETVQRGWFLVDVKGLVLGRVATEIARRLKGKHKPDYTPYVDTGDYIIVLNAGDVIVTGRKSGDKLYYRHSGYPGGLKEKTLGEVLKTYPERVIEHAVKGMLSRGPLGRAVFRKLRVYAGSEHPHEAQKVHILPLLQQAEE